ncbi:uncharacterized protein LOC100214698 isoform X1 [Hydra vulgaris]|uniref:uncharacterized protein LOC100214698 isoform X1 n=1 Tax=Hydra vulgaris TaxID=6087 RepID=UPI001F5F76F6|nr:putative serine/threonine-protein kinase YPL150W isoform X1 [Hydra vulgaris]XP_047127420.1 putative serine/threonine-protein kinase YPL150W isoform X1 [Hydra vulgaris]XP_047127421.1 putative serine/threonine-protein kinase YPL150W isoform X1 [Hydra vulgaris]
MESLPIEVTHVRNEKLEPYKNGKKIGNYLLGSTIGEGSFAKVKEAIHVITGEKVAIKIINKKHASEDRYMRKNLRREALIQQRVRHPNIVQLFEVLETEHFYYLVMEYASGGELSDYMTENKKIDEAMAKKLVFQLVSAVLSMHKAGVVHRDLKIANFLLTEEKDLKITDFGLSNTISEESIEAFQKTGIFPQLLTTYCGSPLYAAPEVIAQKTYGPQVDVWSVGVNMYAMLVGYVPYYIEPLNLMTLYEKMMQRNMSPIPKFLSEECRDLIMRLLEPIPEWRITLEQVLHHKWFKSLEKIQCHVSLGDVMSANKQLCKSVLTYMQQVLNIDYNEAATAVFSNRATHASAVYHLLIRRYDRFIRSKSLCYSNFQIENSVAGITPTFKPLKVKKYLYQGKKIASFSKTQNVSPEKEKSKVDFTINSIRLSGFEKLNILEKNFDKVKSSEKLSHFSIDSHKTPHREAHLSLTIPAKTDKNTPNKEPIDIQINESSKIKDSSNISPNITEWKLTKIHKKPLLTADEASSYRKSCTKISQIANSKSNINGVNESMNVNKLKSPNKTPIKMMFSSNEIEKLSSLEQNVYTVPPNSHECAVKQSNNVDADASLPFSSMNLDELKQALKFSKKKFLETHKTVTGKCFSPTAANSKTDIKITDRERISEQCISPPAATVRQLTNDFTNSCISQGELLTNITDDENNNPIDSLLNSNKFTFNETLQKQSSESPTIKNTRLTEEYPIRIDDHQLRLNDQTPKIVKIAANKKTFELKVKQFAQFKNENNCDSSYSKKPTNGFLLKPLEFNLNFRNKMKSYHQKKQTCSECPKMISDDLINKKEDEVQGETTEDAKLSSEGLSSIESCSMNNHNTDFISFPTDVTNTSNTCTDDTHKCTDDIYRCTNNNNLFTNATDENDLNKLDSNTRPTQKTSIKITTKKHKCNIENSTVHANSNNDSKSSTNSYDSGFFGASSTEDGIISSPTDSNSNNKNATNPEILEGQRIFSKIQTKEKDFYRPTYSQTPIFNRKIEFGIVNDYGIHKTWGSMELNKNDISMSSQKPTFQRANSKIMDNKNKQFAHEIKRNNWSYASLPHTKLRTLNLSKEDNIEKTLQSPIIHNPRFLDDVSMSSITLTTEPSLGSRSSKTFNLARALENAQLRRRGTKSALDNY